MCSRHNPEAVIFEQGNMDHEERCSADSQVCPLLFRRIIEVGALLPPPCLSKGSLFGRDQERNARGDGIRAEQVFERVMDAWMRERRRQRRLVRQKIRNY